MLRTALSFPALQRDVNCLNTLQPWYVPEEVVWESTELPVASVDGDGLAEAVGAGVSYIRANWESVTWTNYGTYCEPTYNPEEESSIMEVAPKVEILRAGQVIASNVSQPVTQIVVAGEKIELTTRLTGGTGTSAWTLPLGKTVKNYVVTVNNGKAVSAAKSDLEESDLNQANINFFWVDGGNALEAKYTVTISGSPRSAIAKFNVKKPTSTLTTTTSTVAVGTVVISQTPSESIFALYYGDAFGTPGIQFEASVTLPSGVTGQSVWAQVVNTVRKRTPAGGSQQTLQGIGLDGVFPDLVDQAVNEDSPLQPAHPPCSYTQVSANDSFSTWILFKPTVANTSTIYVPLRKVNWSWSGNATRGTDCNIWTLSQPSNTQNPASSVTTDHPVWFANVEDFDWQ